MNQNTVRILPHTFVLPTGETRVVACDKPYTSRRRAEYYVYKAKSAKWQDDTRQAIYFLDPLLILQKIEDRKSGVHGWSVRDSGGSKLVKAHSGRGRKAGVSGGYRTMQTGGGQRSFMEA